MAFDNETRNRLKSFVGSARNLLAEEFTRQLQNTYGMNPATGEIDDLSRLNHLDPSSREIAQLLRTTVEHYRATSPATTTADLLDRVVREQAFTVLNRLCALRLAEARGILIESIARGYQSKGFQLYARVANGALGDTAETYRAYLLSVFDELAVDLPVLFYRYSPQGRLFPRETALLALLELINHDDLAPLWAEDETIGWIYQYFNSVEERKKMRDESSAPRNSREMAVRNQFFTPRYVVEFLTDNTLGRTWYEMRKGQTGIVDQCRYFVRRPNEVFLAEGQEPPADTEDTSNLSQEELWNRPVHTLHREQKDPRDLKVLDPAMGSGHFLLYAFDLLETIYREAWEQNITTPSDVTGRTLREDYPDEAAHRRAVPELILRHNLHGVDIDPRAVQIAGLALWLRAQKAWQVAGVKPADRPAIRKSNLVVAEPMPGEQDLLDDFLKDLKPALLGRLVRQVFDSMKLAGEAGTLLRVEDELQQEIEKARREWQALQKRAQAGQRSTSVVDMFSGESPQQLEIELREQELMQISGERFWRDTEERVLKLLREYAEQAESGTGARRRLFADDAAKGFAFVDLCRTKFDVVVMNPPFGETSDRFLVTAQNTYPTWNKNLLCAFLTRALTMVGRSGLVAAIYDRTAVVKSTYEYFRRECFYTDRRIELSGCFGWGVLEANVETTSIVLRRVRASSLVPFFDLRKVDLKQKGSVLEAEAVTPSSYTTIADSQTFRRLPNAVMGFDFPRFARHLFSKCDSLKDAGFIAFQGNALKSEKHFRYWWEVNVCIPKWERLFNGAGFTPFVCSFPDALYSSVSVEKLPSDSSTVLRSMDQQRQKGICYGKRGDHFTCHLVPNGFLFTVEGQFMPIADAKAAIRVALLLNSTVYRFLLNLYCGQHKYSGYVNLLPFLHLQNFDELEGLFWDFDRAARKCLHSSETASVFTCPFLRESALTTIEKNYESLRVHSLQSWHGLLSATNEAILVESGANESERRDVLNLVVREPELALLLDDPDLEASIWSGISLVSWSLGLAFARWDIRFATGEKEQPPLPDPFDPLPVCPPGMLKKASVVDGKWSEQDLPAEGPQDIPPGYPIDIPWDGILVDDPGHGRDIVARLKRVFEVIWGEAADDRLREAAELLGQKDGDLRPWLRREFFSFHLQRYSKSRRKAPIYWPLATPSGAYTLWIYYHRLTDQTLLKAVNDFVEPKIDQVVADSAKLRQNTGRTKKQEQELAALTDLEHELRDFREELLRIAKFWKPNLNDGVQITAAPLWKLFQHKPWQKILKETWQSLEKGDYDWAHLAYSIWPDRVREKCRTDKSLAIAHGLEAVYVEPPESKKKGKKGRKKKEVEADEEGEE